MDDEATQDSAALTDFKEQNRLKIMDLLTWRKAQHERLRDEARGNYEHEANDRAYLVVLKKVRPTDRKQMLADQAADHFLRVDCHHADYASEEAIVKIVEARIAFYTPKEKQYDADGREIDEFGNLVEDPDGEMLGFYLTAGSAFGRLDGVCDLRTWRTLREPVKTSCSRSLTRFESGPQKVEKRLSAPR